jgi:hypothetical protein
MKRIGLELWIVVAMLLAGCAAPTVGPQPTPTSGSAATAIPTAESTATLAPPTSTPAAAATAAPTETAQPPEISRVDVFLVALEDAGQSGQEIGCGDSLVPVEVEVEPTPAPLTAALEALLAIDEQHYGQSGLYNALYQSDLQVESVAIQDGTATIRLTGQLQLGGTCDNPRVKAQLTQIALQFSTVDEVDVFINDKPLDEVLSLK